MTKEFQPNNLTSRAQNPYPEGGDIFMPEPGKGEINSTPHAQDKPQVKSGEPITKEMPPVTLEQASKIARKSWERMYAHQGKSIEELPVDERRTVEMAIEAGHVPRIAGGADTIDPSDFTETVPQAIAATYMDVLIDAGGVGAKIPRNVYSNLIERIGNYVDDPTTTNKNEGRRLQRELFRNYEIDYPQQVERPEGFWQTLRGDDFELLQSDERDEKGGWVGIDQFVNKWFDTLYSSASRRDASQSAAFRAVQGAEQEATVFLSTGVTLSPEKLEYLSDLFDTRIDLLTMNSAISSKSIESIQKASYGLRAHGLLAGTALDDGYTGALFNRMTELLEDERLKSFRGHLTPDIANRIQDMVEEESRKLRDEGVGLHAGKDDVDITRAIRSAYDIMVDSQRMHIIAARGKALFGADAFFSDSGAAFRAFNPKTFSSEKWGLFNVTDERFIREVVEKSLIDEWLEGKREAYSEEGKSFPEPVLDVEGKRELGDLLFKTLASPPDFFSSSWRIKGMNSQIRDYFTYREYENYVISVGADPKELKAEDWGKIKRGQYWNFVVAGARRSASYGIRGMTDNQIKAIESKAKGDSDNFGLFIKLRTAGDEDKPQVWKKIIEYRPEEVIRLLREKFSDAEMSRVNTEIFADLGSYDAFKEKYGAVLRAIREKGFQGGFSPGKMPEQIDFANMTNSQRADLVAAVGEEDAEKIKAAYIRMKKYIRRKGITYTIGKNKYGKRVRTVRGSLFDRDYRFMDIYNKTLTTDDILLGKLEVLEQSQRNYGMIDLSRRYASDLGGDAFVRNMNDLAAGHAYADNIIGFMRAHEEEEKFKHVSEASEKASEYNGRDGQARILRHTMVAYMEASMLPEFLDVVGVPKLPFRIPATLIERIYGPHAKTLGQADRRKMLDKIETLLKSAIQNEIDEHENVIREIERDPGLSPEEKLEKVADRRKKIHEAHERGVKYQEQAEKVLKVKFKDFARLKGLQLFLFLIFFALVEAGRTVKSAAKDL